MLRPRTAIAAATVAVLATVAGCSSGGSASQPGVAANGWDGIVAAAEKEGSVTVWSSSDQKLINKITSAFESKYRKIKVNSLKMDSTTQQTTLDQQLGANRPPSVDTILGNSNYAWLQGLAQKGHFEKPQGPNNAGWDAKYTADGMVAATINPFVMMYNTNKLKSAPTYADLLKPEFKGKIGLNNADPAALKAFYDNWRTQLGEDYVKQIAGQNPQIQSASAVVAQNVASGQLLAGPTGNAASVELLRAQGAPIDFAIPDEGTMAYVLYATAFARSAHPNAALVFLDFVQSPEGQGILNTNNSGVSVLPDVEGALRVPDGKMTLIDWDKYPTDKLQSIDAWWKGLFG
ncbi:ABC transporter substrate-binding protein [Dactylosporangium fulvum]|uniref:ABC transporter substrate-binding protein n=1 Tax=Dactylosporangium fulvum TaxID=53359 RepID=A0ABY5VRH7_9ACTN|nr:ABC transporter substrate-binding protein [Dactylosporangium fulvum]UWP79749.1 ABC transporter substrate-binding protein [Dactylosporangium fulvum]